MVKYVLMLFEVHQPYRLRTGFTNGLLNEVANLNYGGLQDLLFNSRLNEEILRKVSSRCYIPATKLLINSLREFNGFHKVNFSFSGTLLEQLINHMPEVVELFKELVYLELAEVVAEPYYHSLVSLYDDPSEFTYQVMKQVRNIQELFNTKVAAFVNTEMIYNELIAEVVRDLGFNAVFTEGVDRILNGRSPNHVYSASCGIKVLTRNYRLSDDIAFRFSNKSWDQYPLFADKYVDWLLRSPGDLIVIAMDYETFGEHHSADTGIFDFLAHLFKLMAKEGIQTLSVSEAISLFDPVDSFKVPVDETISWADVEKDLSAWLGSEEQRTIFNRHKSLLKLLKDLGDDELIRIWRYLSTSDHLYYMSSKGGASGEVHRYFSPYGPPTNAYCLLSAALTVLELSILRPQIR